MAAKRKAQRPRRVRSKSSKCSASAKQQPDVEADTPPVAEEPHSVKKIEEINKLDIVQLGPRQPLSAIVIRGDCNLLASVGASKARAPLANVAVPLVAYSPLDRPVTEVASCLGPACISHGSPHATTGNSMPTADPCTPFLQIQRQEGTEAHVSAVNSLSTSYDDSGDFNAEDLLCRSQLTVSFGLRPATWDHRGIPPLDKESARLVIVGERAI